MDRRTLRTLAATSGFALVLVACGQKPGVFVDDPLASGGQVVVEGDGAGDGGQILTDADGDGFADLDLDGDGFADLDDPQDGTEAGAGQPDADGSPASGSTGNGGGTGGGNGSSANGNGGGDTGGGNGNGNGNGGGGSGGGGGGGSTQPQGSDRTGVTDDTITIAIHAPITGAAPLPSTSFQSARQTYWDWIESQGEELPGGRGVEVIFEDDRFAPDVARQVCRELSSRAFILVGGGGSDGIQACGQLAQQVRIPYFSPGTTEAGLDGNPWYFASSMSYKQQGPLLAQLVKDRFGDARTAAVFHNTPNVNDGIEGWERAVQAEGINYFRTLRSERSSNPNFGPIIQQLQQDGVEVVHVLMSPLNYIQFAQAANNQGLDLQYVGLGITKGLNAVLGSGCPDIDGGIFLSPFPALETADRIDPDFRRASQRFGTPADDIAWAIWSLNKALHESLRIYEDTFGDDLTREDYAAIISRSRIETGVFPPVQYRPDQRFGGSQMHVLEADCGSGQYRDGGTFVDGF